MKYFSIKKDILATLTYFNMFEYPLKKNEIFSFLSFCDNFRVFEHALDNLTNESVIFKIGDFYSLHNNYSLAVRRYRGNEKAGIMLKKAQHAANLISAFPFVRGVAISGSLSKSFADENTDVDFFIITAANRLWIARTLLHFFKKLTFLFKMQSFFCMNYFIDEDQHGILEKNIYTAVEIVTILPIRGRDIFETFFKENNWTQTFFPNKYSHLPPVKEARGTWLKWIAERILNNRVGNSLDNFLMKMTAKSWNAKTKTRKKDSKGIPLSMHVGKHFSKPNPEYFQKRLLQRYDNNLAEIFEQYQLSKYY